MLQDLCFYNVVEIKHTFSSNEQPILTVRCLKHTNTIELTNHINNTIQLFDDLEEAAQTIQLLMNENATV